MKSKPDDLTQPSHLIAVLTGDLVASRKLGRDDVSAAMEQISRTARHLGDMHDTDTRFTRFRGDGWQITLAAPGAALRAALLIIADLKRAGHKTETRISVGIGHWQSLGSHDLSDASGTAFVLSGRQLDAMPRHARLEVAAEESTLGKAESGCQAAIFGLAAWIASRWSQPQAEAMAMALRGDRATQERLAVHLGITRQAVHARLSGAGYQSIAKALAVLEGLDWGRKP